MAKPPHAQEPFDKIQRVPKGLLELLSLAGGQTPFLLDGIVRGQLDLLQFYGQTQLQTVTANNAAAAEAVQVIAQLGPSWTVLFSLQATIVKTATMTALRGAVALNRQAGLLMQIRQEELGPFGATETGIVSVCQFFPYPLLCPPNSEVIASCPIIGTDANANVSVRAEFGVLG